MTRWLLLKLPWRAPRSILRNSRIQTLIYVAFLSVHALIFLFFFQDDHEQIMGSSDDAVVEAVAASPAEAGNAEAEMEAQTKPAGADITEAERRALQAAGDHAFYTS